MMQEIRTRIVVEDIADVGMPDLWKIEFPIQVKLSNGSFIKVDQGFITDFASVPRFLHSIITPIGRHKLPAIIHDYLYTNHTMSRKDSDQEFLKWLMKKDPKRTIKNRLMFYAVRLFGAKRYKNKGNK